MGPETRRTIHAEAKSVKHFVEGTQRPPHLLFDLGFGPLGEPDLRSDQGCAQG